jgi:outer membrane protein assembly factor BamD
MHLLRPLSLLLLSLLLLQACSSFKKDPTEDWNAKAFYQASSEALYSGEFETAIKYLETLEARFPFDPYAKQAQLDIAYSYYKFDEPDAAISAADRFLRLHPRDPNIDYVYYLKGLVNFKRGTGILDGWFARDQAEHETETLHNSFNDFATLVRRYPDSQYAGDAYQRMIYLRNELAQHEISVAEYYLSRKAWMGAANRARIVVERYEQTTWRKRALEIMVIAYKELGLDQLAADAQRVLDLNKDVSSNLYNFDAELEKPPESSWYKFW